MKKLTLCGRSLLTLDDLSQAEMLGLLDLAARLKDKKRRGQRGHLLSQKNVALIFEKSSTRTRCAFVVAAVDEGASVEYLDVHDIHFGRKESLRDTARVLGRMFDGLAFRGYRQETVEHLAEYSGIPVWNALTDDWHPTQTLADLLTIREQFGELRGLKAMYIGDGRNNVANSLMFGCAKAGMHFVNCTPRELTPPDALVARAQDEASAAGGSVTVEHDPMTAVRGAHVVYTDVWVSMGEEAMFESRRRLLGPYQVTEALMEQTGQRDGCGSIFLHCLPAFHNRDTEVTRDIGALEVVDEVFEAPYSRVFDQAENRVHTIKAVMVATLT